MLKFLTNLSLLFAVWTLGRTNLHADWQKFITSMSLVLNNFIRIIHTKNLWICRHIVLTLSVNRLSANRPVGTSSGNPTCHNSLALAPVIQGRAISTLCTARFKWCTNYLSELIRVYWGVVDVLQLQNDDKLCVRHLPKHLAPVHDCLIFFYFADVRTPGCLHALLDCLWDFLIMFGFDRFTSHKIIIASGSLHKQHSRSGLLT